MRTLLAHTGDDGVEAINDLDGDTARRLLDRDASCSRGPVSGLTAGGGSGVCEKTLDEFRDSVVKASTDADLSYGELDDVVRRVDDLDGEKRAQAIRFIAKTDADGIEAVSDLSDDELRMLLSITYDGKIDGDRSFVDADLDGWDAIDLAEEGTVEDMMIAVKKSGSIPGQKGDKIWLEEGNSGVGWKHLLERHEGQFLDKQFISDREDIKEVIYRTVNNGKPNKIPDSEDGGTAFVHKINGKEFTVIVGDNGFIVTARPGSY